MRNAMDLVVPSLLFGLAFSVVFTAVLLGCGLVARDFGLHSYPPAIQERYGPKSPRGLRVTKIAGALVGVSIAATLTGLFLVVRDGEPLGFWTVFAAAEIALMTFNLVDLVVLDWLVFVTWRPPLVVLPGTEDMPEYHDWYFHLVGFGKGVVIVTVIAVVAAGFAVAAEAVI
jgi:hypothetical protein